ncbi:UNVERIFIED_CONTAM: hypothetical protein FKN15_073132 [Acipenser sinensis]
MVQAQSIQFRKNVRTIGAQVYEQVVRGAYSNGTDYPFEFNLSEPYVQTTTFLPEGFTYLPNETCPERLPSMNYPFEFNLSEPYVQTTTFLPEGFTYLPNETCPERLPSMIGLNNLKYLPQVTRKPLYSNITINLTPELAPVSDY